MKRLAVLALAALLPAGCQHPAPPAGQVGQGAHYVLGPPYQAGGVWHYPREQYDARLTGLAVVQPAAHGPATANGEAYDPTAMAAAHRTMQLPAIARLTNLETGRQVTVRVNDRGPDNAGRLIAVTPRVATLLGFPRDGVARVRLEVLPAESHAITDALPDAPRLKIAAAPREAVRTASLDGRELPASRLAQSDLPDLPPVPMTLPETVVQVASGPGALFVRLSSFTDRKYAVRQAAMLGAGTKSVQAETGGAGRSFAAELGPFATVGEADTALDQAIRAGVTDARIVVE